MNRSILFLPAFILLVLFSVNLANADVLIEDARVNSDLNEGGITSGVIDTGSGGIGDFELIVCGIDSDGSNPFNAPSPGSWNEINNSTCSPQDCQIGIWGRFSDSQDSEEVTCSWGADSLGFAAGSIRYRNVDRDNPIIDSACTEVEGENLVLPSVSSEPGAQLVLLQLVRVFGEEGEGSSEDVEFDEFSGGFSVFLDLSDDSVLSLLGLSGIDVNGEGFEGLSEPLDETDISVKLCVVSLRMAPKTIPTLSEWGLIAMAGILGIVGFMVMRRRKVTA